MLSTNGNYSSLSRNHPLAGQSSPGFPASGALFPNLPQGQMPSSLFLEPQSPCQLLKAPVISTRSSGPGPHFLSQAPSKHLLPLPFYRTNHSKPLAILFPIFTLTVPPARKVLPAIHCLPGKLLLILPVQISLLLGYFPLPYLSPWVYMFMIAFYHSI